MEKTLGIKVGKFKQGGGEAYVNAARDHIPGSEEKVCFDKFHMAQHLGNAVDKVRREEHRRLMEREHATLKGSRHLWLTNPANLSRDRFKELDL